MKLNNHTQAGRKKVTIRLTLKQIEAITAALYEWSEIEERTVSGKSVAAYADKVRRSIYKQVEAGKKSK